MQDSNLANLPFSKAAEIWRGTRSQYLKPKSISMYEQYIKALNVFFADVKLISIHIGHLREYQVWRQQPRMSAILLKNGRSKPHLSRASASCINHELNCLSQILSRAGLWAAIKDYYEPLPLPKWTPPRVLTEEEEHRFFQVAASNHEWLVAYLCSSITANTTAAGCELRGLRFRDVDLEQSVLYIPSDSVKNEFRARVIPLNERAKLQVERLMQRARELGAGRPEHFIIPFREKRGVYDPTRHTTGWKTAFREVKAASGLHWLRPHDLRHHAITKLLEQPNVSEETVKSIAGHVSKRILEHYSHIRISAKRTALNTIQPKPPQSSRGMQILLKTSRKAAKAGA